MPIFRTGAQLLYYAHVPKCAGSALEHYMAARFGAGGFHDNQYMKQAPAERWNKTSPQHIDVGSLERLFPAGFFDAVFTVVRHPVARIVSAYHFQLEVEKSISEQVVFAEWLEDLSLGREENPFLYDNHVRPMAEIVPEGAQVFHLEHGLDQLIPWFDTLTGQKAGPRAIAKINERGAYTGGAGQKAEIGPDERARIAELYGVDFARFGYDPDEKMPAAPAPVLSDSFVVERDAALKAMNNPVARVAGKIRRKIGL